MNLDDLMKEIAPLLQQIVTLLVTAALGWVSVKVSRYFEARTQAENLQRRDLLARRAVQSVEQQTTSTQSEVTSTQKKELAVHAMRTLAPNASTEEIHHLIEAAVRDLDKKSDAESVQVQSVETPSR